MPEFDSDRASKLPQPGLRLVGIASLGVGTGLFSASTPPEVLAVAFAPAVVALVVVALRSTFAGPASTGAELEEIRRG